MSISFAATPQAKEGQQTRAYVDDASAGAPPSRRTGYDRPYVDRDHWNKVFTQPEYFDGIAKQKGMVEGAKVSLHGDDYVYRQAMMGYLSATRNVPLDDMRSIFDSEKDGFAQKVLGKKTATARELFDWHKTKFERENEKSDAARTVIENVTRNSLQDAMLGGDTPFVESVTQSIAATGDMFTEEEKSRLWEKAEEQDKKIRATQAAVAPEARFLFSALGQITGQQAGMGAPDIREVAGKFAQLPDNQRKAIYELAGGFAQLQKTDKGFWYQMAESLGRGASDIVERVPRNFREQTLRGQLRLLESEQPVFRATGVAGAEFSAAGNEPVFGATQGQMVTPEEREQAKAKIQSDLGVLKVERELRDLAERVVDPIKTVSFLPEIVEEGLYGAARSLPYTAAAAIPFAGIPAVAAALFSSNYDRIMLEYPDLDPDKAALIAAISAPIEAGLERMKVNTLMGRTPIVAGLFKRLQHPNQRNLTRILIGSGAIVAEQNVQEILQNATFPLVQTVAAALDQDMPDYDWAKRIEGMPRELAVQFVALLPLSLMGIGALSHREMTRGADYIRNKSNLEKAGYGEDQIDRITGAATADEAQTILQEESGKRDPELVKAAAKRVLDEVLALREQKAPASLPRLEKQGADYVVLSPEGKEMARSTDQTVAEQALVSARRETVQREMRDVHTGINEAVEFIQKVNEARQRGEDIAEVIREQSPRTLLTDYEANPTQENLDRLFETVRAFGQDINEPAELANFPVIGSNQGALAEGIWRSVIRINEGADGTIVMREFAQDNLKRAISEGRTTMDFVRQQLNDVLPQIDSSRIKRQIRTETDTDVIEAFSDIAVAYFRGSIREEMIPAGLRGIMRRLAIATRDIFRRAYNLARLRAEGKLDRDFEALLAEAVGVDQQTLVDRARERTEQDMRGEDGLTDVERRALQIALQEDMEQDAFDALRENGTDILDAVREAGGLPSIKSSKVYQYAGELKRIREAQKGGNAIGVKATFNLFRKNAPDLDALIKDLQSYGFSQIETPSDLFDMIERRIATGRPIYGYEAASIAAQMENYSIAITPQQDSDYLAAVERDDMEMAQRMVDEAAKAAGYDIGPVWHGGADGFNVFDWSRIGEQGTTEGKGFYFSNDRDLAAGYADRHGGRLLRVYLRSGKPINGKKQTITQSKWRQILRLIHAESEKYDEGTSPLWNYADIGSDGLDKAINEAVANTTEFSDSDVDAISGFINGGADPQITYDAIYKLTGMTGIVESEAWGRDGHTIQIATSANHIKLADPVTRDSQGNVIPLSQRFDATTADINYSIAAGEAQRGADVAITLENRVASSINSVPRADIFQSAKRRFGVTQSLYEAGYVLPDGTMLDFSGRADAGYVQGDDLVFRPRAGERDYMQDQRSTDHREVEWDDMPRYTEIWASMTDFLRLGAIRIDGNSGMISMHSRARPTSSQARVLKDLVVAADGAYVDLEDDLGNKTAMMLESAKWPRVQGLLERWANGETPAVTQNYSIGSRAQPDVERNVVTLPEVTISGPANYSIQAWHASPYKYDKADLSKAGTGEGAAVYGWGFYMAENPAVSGDGGSYQLSFQQDFDTGKRPRITINGKAVNASNLAEFIDDISDRTYNTLVEYFMAQRSQDFVRYTDRVKRGDWDAAFKEGVTLNEPQIYRVEVDADQKEFLDWDQPFADQSEFVQSALRDVIGTKTINYTNEQSGLKTSVERVFVQGNEEEGATEGAGIYRGIARLYKQREPYGLEREVGASMMLKERGIKGIRYLDQGSRGRSEWIAKHPQGGENTFPDEQSARDFVKRNPEHALIAPNQTYNYVIFDDSLIKILTRNGEQISVEQAAQEVQNYSISTQREIDRVQAAMGTLDRSPLSRIKIYEKMQDRFLRVMADNRETLAAMEGGDLSQVRRTQILQALGELDGIISALPAEIRAKIGGYTQLAKVDPMDVFKGDQRVSEVRGMSGAIISAWMREGLNIGQAQKKTELPAGYRAERNLDPTRADRAIADVFIQRINRINEALEKFLRDEYNDAAVELFKRAKPQRSGAGEKPKGKLGATVHELFDTLKEATEWSAEQAQAWADGQWSRIEAGELNPYEQAHATLAAQVVPLFADWANADSTQRAAAVSMGKDILERAYKGEQQRIIAQRTKRGYDRTDLSRDAGVSAEDDKARQNAVKRENSLPAKWEATMLNLLNFDQVLRYVFGNDSKIAQKISDRQRKADNVKSDDIAALSDDWASLLTRLGGGEMQGQQLMFDLSRMDEEIDDVSYSQNQLVAITMMWMQPKGRQHMEGFMDSDGQPAGKWHYNQDFVNKAEKLLRPESKVIREYLLLKYDQEYDAINKVYRKVYGLNLPKNQFYSPLIVESINAPAQAGIDPVTGGVFAAGANAPSALRSRGGAIAQPVFRDAVQTYFGHMLQMAHWKAYAEFNSETSALLGHRDTRNVVKGKAGEQAATVMNNWQQYFQQGGNKDAANHLAINQMINRVTSNFAAIALFGRVSTLALQVTQLGAASAKMPVGAYLSRFGKLMSGRLGWTTALDSDYIQRRIKDMPPAVALAMQGLRAEKPSQIRNAAKWLGQHLSGFDGFFTAGTYAIVYDYQLSQARQNGMGGQEAADYAREATERIVDEIAQPTRAGARSIYELNSTNPVARAVWAFSSESRKNMGLLMYSGAKGGGRNFGKALTYVLLLNGLVGIVIRNAFRDMRDDDDDEIFDEKNWGWKRLAAQFISDPIYGIPVVGETIEGGIYTALGVYQPSGPVFDVTRGIPAAKRLGYDHPMAVLEGEAEFRDIVADVNRVLAAAGLFNSTIAGAASISNLAKDVFEVTGNALGDE
jgi:hypothetical protein